MRNKPPGLKLTAENIAKYITYNPETGEVAVRIKGDPDYARGPRSAGVTHRLGHTEIFIEGRYYKAHRLAWLYHYGEDPGDEWVVQRNGDKKDNRIANLELRKPGFPSSRKVGTDIHLTPWPGVTT